MTNDITATSPSNPGRPGHRHRVVIVGTGFGGLFAARNLRRAPVDLTMIGKTSYHLFQPLLYQVATGVLSQGEIAPAVREVLRKQANATVLLGDVTEVDVAHRTVTSHTPLGSKVTPYDSLIVAAGAGQSYFGNDHFAEFAPGMKSIDDALELRGRIFGAFELAELLADPEQVQEWLTFVVIGAGPTGVEMAGQIAELAHSTLKRDFQRIDPTAARVLLLDAGPAVLAQFGDRLSQKAKTQLERLGVEVQLNVKVVDVDESGVDVLDPDGSRRRIPSRAKVWAAGVSASSLGRVLAEQTGAALDRSGRIQVNPDTTLPGHPEIFVIGDMMALDGLPGVAQVAMQQGKYAAKTIAHRLGNKPALPPFHYFDKGSLATVSRFHAVASVGSRIRLAGFVAWVMWLAVHLIYLIGFKNRVTTLLHWAVTFIGNSRSERVSTEQQVFARMAIQRQHEEDSRLNS
jgi:NADH dehydrogenase